MVNFPWLQKRFFFKADFMQTSLLRRILNLVTSESKLNSKQKYVNDLHFLFLLCKIRKDVQFHTLPLILTYLNQLSLMFSFFIQCIDQNNKYFIIFYTITVQC